MDQASDRRLDRHHTLELQARGAQGLGDQRVRVVGPEIDRLVPLRLSPRLAAQQQRRPGSGPAVPHVGVDENPPNAGDLEETLVQLHIRHHTAREHEGVEARLLDVVPDVFGRDDLEGPLIYRGHVDLREQGRQVPGEVDVVALDDPEAPRLAPEPAQDELEQDLGIAVRGQPHDLSLVSARLEPQRRRDALVERP